MKWRHFQRNNSTRSKEYENYEDTYGDYDAKNSGYNPNAEYELI
jgi:hypothetical protein